MICKNCGTENPDESLFCIHCGKRLDGNKVCPSCGATCPEEALFCNSCGRKIVKDENGEEPVAAESQPQSVPAAPKEKKDTFEKVKSAFDLSGGICLMVAVLFAFVFVFCMGITATASTKSSMSSVAASASETKMMWEYFCNAYVELGETLELMPSYSGYYEAANYIPIVLSTVVCAGTLLSVLICTIIAAIKYGRHFKNPQINYAKPAIAAVLSFILGATAFLMINSTSMSFSSSIKVSITYSDATLAGIILGAIFLWLYCASRVVMLGKELVTKKAIVNFVCTIVGILFVSLTAAFAASPAISFKEVGSSSNSVGLSFCNSNMLISYLYPNPDGLNTETLTNFITTYVTSALAQGVQIALLVLAFILLIKRVSGVGNNAKSCLGLSIAMIVLAVVYLALTCVAIHFATELIGDDEVKIAIAAGPIVALIASAFALADAITHEVLLGKTK